MPSITASHGRQGQIPIGEGSGQEIDTLAFGRGLDIGIRIGRSVALLIGQVDRGLEAGHKTFVAVVRRTAEGQKAGA